MVSNELGISKGNFNLLFSSKEYILAELVETLCKFQWEMIESETDDGTNKRLSICYELMTMAYSCEQNKVAKDFFVSTYQSPVCLKIIQKNNTERAKGVLL